VSAWTWTGVPVGSPEVHSPEWHAARAAGIGGSEVAAILGLSPWESPYSLWHAKTGGWITDPDPEMEWGTLLEPALLAWYRQHADNPVDLDESPGLFVHRSRRWQRAAPDGIAWIADGPDGDGSTSPRIVECKKASSDDDWGRPGTDEIPPYYRTQVVWYMDVLGVDVADIVVTNLGRAPDVYVVTYDPAEARLLRGHAAAFWRSLQGGVMPDLDGHAQTLQAVRRLHPDIDGTDVTVPADLAEAWADAKAALKGAEQAARLHASELLDAMGDARRALTPDGVPFARRQPGRGGAVSLYPIGATK
jgi:putative phage-type endonuclease